MDQEPRFSGMCGSAEACVARLGGMRYGWLRRCLCVGGAVTPINTASWEA